MTNRPDQQTGIRLQRNHRRTGISTLKHCSSRIQPQSAPFFFFAMAFEAVISQQRANIGFEELAMFI